jgi:hypothetical protein
VKCASAVASGACYPWRKEEDVTSIPKTLLEPDDFPVNADGKKIKKQDGASSGYLGIGFSSLVYVVFVPIAHDLV